MDYTKLAQEAIDLAIVQAQRAHKEFLTPEHLLYALHYQSPFEYAAFFGNVTMDHFERDLKNYIDDMECVNTETGDYELHLSVQCQQMLALAEGNAYNAGKREIDVPHIINAILHLDDSQAAYVLRKHFGSSDVEILNIFTDAYHEDEEEEKWHAEADAAQEWLESDNEERSTPWKDFVICINEHINDHNPLIGREEELERTIQILCRKDKNNPLHVGEPGVGKTALVYGLAALIEKGEVPERLKGCKIYSMDLGTLLAGTQFRGDFEKRIKAIMDGIQSEGKAIVYIDEIHNLIGAGQTGEGSMDASNMLKPYLEKGDIRFIGSTTYQEYNRYFQKSKGIVRRFQQIDINEPSIDETVKIIEGLIPGYEEYHSVKYSNDAVRYAVEKSTQFISDRFLPDKAIDLIDEAGAYRQLHPLLNKKGEKKAQRYQTVDTILLSDILSRVCKIDAKALSEANNNELEDLDTRIASQIYGQDAAIRSVVEAVQMSKAGLLEGNKPLASLLFVGPTGVGKTEVCKVLANELGISLVRFDMSEYTEKHTVAKLIGSPAGYVGYEDGGLLTDAIRKTPNCVLLLDEIEKAHSDIYNILLQVMDYARLTDNKGNKADFKNVILIMTSNAGAQYASQASVGFSSSVSSGQAMMNTVKKTFKPEFLNRLSGTVIFNDMDEHMATLILDKKLRQLSVRLTAKNVEMELTPEAHQHLLRLGFTHQYGAREMDRVIQQQLNPLLMREILFGTLRKGGKVLVTFDEDKKCLVLQKNV